MATLDDYRREAGKVHDRLKKLNARYLGTENEVGKAQEEFKELEMQCYYDNKEKCLQQIDEAAVKVHRIKRRKYYEVEKCSEEPRRIDESFDKRFVKNMLELDKLRRYEKLIRVCVDLGASFNYRMVEFYEKSIYNIRKDNYRNSQS